MLDDMAARRAYTAAAMDALRAENALRQSDGSAAYRGDDDEDGGFAAGVDASALLHPIVERASGGGDQYGDGEEEVIGYIDEDGNIVSTEENAIGVVLLRGGGDEVQR
jgi:hypothetical protein